MVSVLNDLEHWGFGGTLGISNEVLELLPDDLICVVNEASRGVGLEP